METTLARPLLLAALLAGTDQMVSPPRCRSLLNSSLALLSCRHRPLSPHELQTSGREEGWRRLCCGLLWWCDIELFVLATAKMGSGDRIEHHTPAFFGSLWHLTLSPSLILPQYPIIYPVLPQYTFMYPILPQSYPNIL